jgi:hypothetical protein
MRFRFGLRTLAVLVTVACIAFWAVPAAMDWYYWHRVRAIIIDTMTDLAGPAGNPSVYLGFARQNEYYLSNHELKWDSSVGAMTDLSATRRSDAVFVILPKKAGLWVNSSDEVVRLLKQASATN